MLRVQNSCTCSLHISDAAGKAWVCVAAIVTAADLAQAVGADRGRRSRAAEACASGEAPDGITREVEVSASSV